MSRFQETDFKELVRQRTDLVGLVSETVALQAVRGGAEYLGLCPFHDDHRPSMRVYSDRQTFRCWACNTGGDCFEFVMKRDRVEFREALELLATRAGMEIPRAAHRGGGPRDELLAKPRLFETLQWAEREFHAALCDPAVGRTALKYLESRGFSSETIRKHRLGYHPPGKQWLQQRAQGKYSLLQLHAVRLVGESSYGPGYFDHFEDRVLFPIRDAHGRTVAFGGRVLPGNDHPAKYWNSLEGPLFSKSRLVFGLDSARDALLQSQTAIVVEGYVDCLLAHQHGLQNTVCTLGTAMTEAHVAILKRFVRKVVLVYDGDEAGQNAAEKALVRLLAQEIDLRILSLPEGQDPADLLTSAGGEAFRTLVETAPEAWDFQLRRSIARIGLDSLDAAHRVLEEMLSVLRVVPAESIVGSWQARQDLLLGKLAQRLGISEQRVRARLAELRRSAAPRPPAAAASASAGVPGIERAGAAPWPLPQPGQAAVCPGSALHDSAPLPEWALRPDRDQQLEIELLQILLTKPEQLMAIRGAVEADDFRQPELRALFESWCSTADEAGGADGNAFLDSLSDPSLKNLATWINETGHARRAGPDLWKHTLSCVQQRRQLAALASPRAASTADAPQPAGREALRLAAERAAVRQRMQTELKRISTQS